MMNNSCFFTLNMWALEHIYVKCMLEFVLVISFLMMEGAKLICFLLFSTIALQHCTFYKIIRNEIKIRKLIHNLNIFYANII